MSMLHSTSSRITARETQRGAVLVISLLLLLVLTIIGVTAMQMTRLQERMAGGTRDMNLALQGAESGLRNGEVMLQAQPARPDTCTGLPCDFWQVGAPPVRDLPSQDTPTWRANADEYEIDRNAPAQGEINSLDEDPRFVVESIGFVSDTLTTGNGSVPQGRDFYQVTSRSTGGSGKANTVLRSTYARRF